MTKAVVKSTGKKPDVKKDTSIDTVDPEDMFNVGMDLTVTLECPVCKVQQVMTLEEYFTKIDYDYRDTYRKLLHCEMCERHPELMFFKVNRSQILLAGMNWERKRQGISEEQMKGMIGVYSKTKKAVKSKRKPKSLKA